MVCLFMVYFSEYLSQVVGDINVPLHWVVNPINKFEWEVLLGKGIWIKVKGTIFYYIYYLHTYILNLGLFTKSIIFLYPSSKEWDEIHLFSVSNL